MDFDDFDVIDFLESRDIEMKTTGKNVTAGWVEIECPFCEEDPSFHFGVNLDSGLGNCWICGTKSNPIKMVRAIDKCSWLESELTINEFSQNIKPKTEKKVIIPPKELEWPKNSQTDIPNLHRWYLEARRFDPDFLTKKYRLKFVGNFGDWKFRVIIPIIEKHNPVTYTSRDVTGHSELAYRHLPDSKSIVPIKNTLYNMDSIRNGKAILVEGVVDVWRIGDGALCSFGTQLTPRQKELLTNLKSLYIMFDHDATDKAYKLANELSTNIKNLEVIELPSGDPGDLALEDIRQLRKELEM
jgi:DNA primase